MLWDGKGISGRLSAKCMLIVADPMKISSSSFRSSNLLTSLNLLTIPIISALFPVTIIHR